MTPESRKALFDVLLKGDIAIGVDTEFEELWQIVRIPLVLKAEALAAAVSAAKGIVVEEQRALIALGCCRQIVATTVHDSC